MLDRLRFDLKHLDRNWSSGEQEDCRRDGADCEQRDEQQLLTTWPNGSTFTIRRTKHCVNRAGD